MLNYSEETYGARFADVYDSWYGDYDPEMIETLVKFAEGGRALELGIGTGRAAIPLAERGIAVEGIDISSAMVERLHAKPGGKDIPVQIGSFASFSLERQFKLIYVVINTFYGLLTQEEQVQCFQSVAQHLTPQGLFVIEAFVPDLGRFDRGQTVRVSNLADDAVRLDVSVLDLTSQVITSQSLNLAEAGVQVRPVRVRYVWPAEMDLMARLAGMELKQRAGDWSGVAFTSRSSKHISVYGLKG